MDRTSFFGKSFKYSKHRIPPLAELISTEETYLDVLDKIVNGYMVEYLNENSEIPVPNELKEHNVYLLFANVYEIYQWHKSYFLKGLILHQRSMKDLSKLFTDNEIQFHMYAKYCNNKTISDYLVNANFSYFDKVKNKLKHKLTINDLLIQPVQRLLRYQLLLDQIQNHLKKHGSEEDANSLNEAYSMIRKVGLEVNEFPTLSAIKNFDGLISDQGKLLFQEFLTCDYKGKTKKFYVFLFKRFIIFTEKQEPKRKLSQPTYNCRLQIPMNKLHFKEMSNNKFLLQLMDPNSPDVSLHCYADEEELHHKWIQVIKNQLSLQMSLIHNLVNPPIDENQREMLL